VKEAFVLIYFLATPIGGERQIEFPAIFNTEDMCERVIDVFEEHDLYTDHPMVCVEVINK